MLSQVKVALLPPRFKIASPLSLSFFIMLVENKYGRLKPIGLVIVIKEDATWGKLYTSLSSFIIAYSFLIRLERLVLLFLFLLLYVVC